jgi:hypothetical protein
MLKEFVKAYVQKIKFFEGKVKDWSHYKKVLDRDLYQ